MSEIKIIKEPNTKAELKQITEERSDDLKEREMLSWIRYNFMHYREGTLSGNQLKETLILGIENILKSY